MLGLGDRIGIDLGTATIVVYALGRGIVIREPSVVAIDDPQGRVLAVGQQAQEMLGRTPGSIVAKRPMRDGVIADYSITREMLTYLIRKACGVRGRIFKPLAVICVPSAATSVERRAALDATRAASAGKIIPIEEPMATEAREARGGYGTDRWSLELDEKGLHLNRRQRQGTQTYRRRNR